MTDQYNDLNSFQHYKKQYEEYESLLTKMTKQLQTQLGMNKAVSVEEGFEICVKVLTQLRSHWQLDVTKFYGHVKDMEADIHDMQMKQKSTTSTEISSTVAKDAVINQLRSEITTLNTSVYNLRQRLSSNTTSAEPAALDDRVVSLLGRLKVILQNDHNENEQDMGWFFKKHDILLLGVEAPATDG